MPRCYKHIAPPERGVNACTIVRAIFYPWILKKTGVIQ
jgi:hypothetical protein